MSALDGLILITGCPRSGTSMTAGIINLCGAFGGKMRKAPEETKHPIFENEDICAHVMVPYLRSIHADPRGQRPLPDVSSLIPIPDLKQRVEKFMYSQHYNGSHRVFYKSALIALTWPIWRRAFPNARWMIVRRADEDIVYSCMRTAFMNAYRTRQGWRYWISQYKQRFQAMHDARLNIGDIWPTKFVEGDFSEIQACVRWLGLKWQEQNVQDFIEPALFHNGEVKNGN